VVSTGLSKKSLLNYAGSGDFVNPYELSSIINGTSGAAIKLVLMVFFSNLLGRITQCSKIALFSEFGLKSQTSYLHISQHCLVRKRGGHTAQLMFECLLFSVSFRTELYNKLVYN